ncbi:MAG: carboxylesterase/lipase family protein [Acidimicrobiales bacterium]
MGEALEVQTTSGPVRGAPSQSVLAFKGIPYAQPPVGRLRLAAPEPPVPWANTMVATDFGPVAPQLLGALEAMLGGGEPAQSEAGCLTLNVWTPATDDARRPVMVWIHGGAFVTGSGAATWYDGAALARRGDVVVVTFNYRLGVLGFLYLGETSAGTGDGAVGNFGLLDQLAALRWVRQNAAAFGGDPDCVTVFGQSAGAMSIGALFASPDFPGLARRAVLQSGACDHTVSVEHAARNSAVILDRLGLSPSTDGLLDALRALPTATILEAQAPPLPHVLDGMSYLPVRDGVSLTRNPMESVAQGALRGLDLLVGTNADEARLFMVTDPSLADMDEEGLATRVLEVWGPADAPRIVDRYRMARPDSSPRDLWLAISTAKSFRIPAIRLAELASRTQTPGQAATFAYLFKWRTPAFGGAFGSCHSLEIPFVFDNLDKPGMAQVLGGEGSAAALAAEVADAWVAFARYGRPALRGGPDWVPYSVTGGGHQPGERYRGTMCLDTVCQMVEDPDGDERRLWEGTA